MVLSLEFVLPSFDLKSLNEILFAPTQTILGDFQKEQQRFVEEKKAKQSGN